MPAPGPAPPRTIRPLRSRRRRILPSGWPRVLPAPRPRAPAASAPPGPAAPRAGRAGHRIGGQPPGFSGEWSQRGARIARAAFRRGRSSGASAKIGFGGGEPCGSRRRSRDASGERAVRTRASDRRIRAGRAGEPLRLIGGARPAGRRTGPRRRVGGSGPAGCFGERSAGRAPKAGAALVSPGLDLFRGIAHPAFCPAPRHRATAGAASKSRTAGQSGRSRCGTARRGEVRRVSDRDGEPPRVRPGACRRRGKNCRGDPNPAGERKRGSVAAG